MPRLRLRQQQQRAHDLREPVDILQRVEHRLAVLFRGLRGEERHFELAADRGDRRAQFVRHVGGELLICWNDDFQALDHAVESEDQVIELVARTAASECAGSGSIPRCAAPRCAMSITGVSARPAMTQPSTQPRMTQRG